MKSVNTDQSLINAIDILLTENVDGLSEYDLMKLLDERFHSVYPKPDLSDQFLLFQHHFFLRHCVYQLKLQLASAPKNQWQLKISALKIQKESYQTSADPFPQEYDPLETYYGDLSNLNKESQQSVQDMLEGFWRALAKYQHQPKALKTLGLTGLETKIQQKLQYKKLAQEYHPDKGGDKETFQEIQTAWEKIKKR